jgi:hypothetical protein
MQDFPEHTDLGNGTSWSAKFKGHDWAHYGSFFFIVTIFEVDKKIKQFPVEVDDHKLGDSTCEYSQELIRQMVQQDLHRLAREGKANTRALL